MPTAVTSPVGCRRFSVSQAVSSGLCPGTCVVSSRSVSSDLDTLTPLLELYVRMRERRHALVVGGTNTSSRHWSPASPSPVPHSSEPRPGSLEVPGMGLRPCGPQASARSREMDSDQVRYRFNGLGRGVPSQQLSTRTKYYSQQLSRTSTEVTGLLCTWS
ncbi:hypothetical protein Taro_040372 [Colocasia esculenta]|uniref:Uncharacterized protein n=1 Tax=Colocasia esculenta TaxID=4460 RepID=A0A843WSV2_COLES|nr:hypothetical protein [Colocasia esculenta]